MSDHSECSICLSDLRRPVRTRCGHTFCLECFLRALDFRVGSCPYCRQTVSLFSTIDIASNIPLRLPDVESIFGNVFLQAGKPGIAAYHFESLEECYISYTAAPDTWRRADGSAPPPRKFFENTTYDAENRTFRGTIEWGDNSFNDDARWEYTMVFSESFSVISGGEMQAYSSSGEPTRTNCFPNDLCYWREVRVDSIFGQCFVQGRKVGLASYHFENPEECFISYRSAPDDWCLADGSSPPLRKLFESPSYDVESRTFSGTIEWGENTFGGDARWKYTMIFSPNFEKISGGTVRAFGFDGNEKATLSFNHDLYYQRVCEEIEEFLLLVPN